MATGPGERSGGGAREPESLERLAARLTGGYRSVGSMVYEILRDAIVSGTLAPGEPLRQESLAEAIGVSRVPVRSALIQLESDGLVRFQDRRGAVVTALTPAQVDEIYDIRLLLETHALRKSMAAMTPERLDRLRALADEADHQAEGSSFVEARTRFYREFYDASANPELVELIDELRLKVGRYLLGWKVGHDKEHSHAGLVGAVATGDPEHAVSLLQTHLSEVRSGVLAKMAEDDTAGAANAESPA